MKCRSPLGSRHFLDLQERLAVRIAIDEFRERGPCTAAAMLLLLLRLLRLRQPQQLGDVVAANFPVVVSKRIHPEALAAIRIQLERQAAILGAMSGSGAPHFSARDVTAEQLCDR